MDKIMAFVQDVLGFFKDFKVEDIIEYIKSIFQNPVQPR